MTAPHPSFVEALAGAPSRSGCYILEDARGHVLYVGRAVDIRKRTRVYLRPGADGRARLADLLENARGASFRVCGTEVEAILLEEQLVKELQPPLNVVLKDDKSFLHIRLGMNHAFPGISLTRRKSRDGQTWGPFAHAGEARRTKKLIQRAFGLRDCSDSTLANRSRHCIKHEMGLCSAPCVGKRGGALYKQDLDAARQVLEGKTAGLIAAAEIDMERASASENYEAALRARDRMNALRSLNQPQRVRLRMGEDFDVLGLDERGCFSLLEYRGGAWLGSRHGEARVVPGIEAAVSSLLSALYGPTVEIPPEILLPAFPEDTKAIEDWLSGVANHPVRLKVPLRGEKRALVRLAESNARILKRQSSRSPWGTVARALAPWAGGSPPSVVDAVDVSHFQGKERVASRVRFVEGVAAPESWRRFVVKAGDGNDDARAMREVVGRILVGKSGGLPDLLVLDGGPPQLAAGLAAAGDTGASLSMVALAKARGGGLVPAKEERVWIPGAEEAIPLGKGHAARFFLEEIRDEAHRFAITHHRSRRANIKTVLTRVSGIGPAKGRALLEWSGGDLGLIRDSAPRDLAAVPGMNRGLAEAVQQHLRDFLP